MLLLCKSRQVLKNTAAIIPSDLEKKVPLLCVKYPHVTMTETTTFRCPKPVITSEIILIFREKHEGKAS